MDHAVTVMDFPENIALEPQDAIESSHWTVKQVTLFPIYVVRHAKESTCRPRWLSWMRRPTGDQEVAGSTPAEVGNILSWRLIMNIFYGHSLPSADSRRAVVSFWRKNVHNTG